MPDEEFDPWATAVADGTSSALKKATKKKDVWGSFRAGEAEALSDSEAAKAKPGSGKKKKGDKKPSGPSGPNLARRRIMDHKISGSVESWSNTYGWIRPYQHVGHPKANKHGGKLYIHAKDLVGGIGFLPTGAAVEFYVFEDDAGLGAEECALAEWSGKAGKGWGSKGWDAGKGWGKGMWDMSKGWAKGMWGGFDGWPAGGKKGWDGGKGFGGGKGKSSGKGEWGGKDRVKGGKGEGDKGDGGRGTKDGKGKHSSKGSLQAVPPKDPGNPGVSEIDQAHTDWSHYTGMGGIGAGAATGPSAGPGAGSGFAAATGSTAQAQCRQPIASPAAAPLLASAHMRPVGGKPLPGGPETNWNEVAPPAPYLINSVAPAPSPLPSAIGSVHVNQVPYGSYSMMPGMLSPNVPQQVAMSNPAIGLGPGLYHAHVPPPPPGGPGPYEHPEGIAAGPIGAWPTWTG